jgi:hypothetical protein
MYINANKNNHFSKSVDLILVNLDLSQKKIQITLNAIDVTVST